MVSFRKDYSKSQVWSLGIMLPEAHQQQVAYSNNHDQQNLSQEKALVCKALQGEKKGVTLC